MLRSLPLPLMRPAANVLTVMYATFPAVFWPTTRTPQPLTVMIVFCLVVFPLWETIVVGITSGCAHRSPNAPRALCEPVGRLTVTLDTGTSGVDAKFVVVMPFLMLVLPVRITRTWLGLSTTRSKSGNEAPACETRIAAPVSLPGSVGVTTVAPPTNEPLGHL